MERKIDQIKKLRPHYARLSDDQIVDLVRESDYPDRSREEIAQALGVQMAAPAEQPLPERNAFGFVNDQVINMANAAATWAKAGVDLVAPDSAASRGISEFIQSGKEKQSDKQKALDQQLAQKLQAEGDSELGKAGAYLGHMITSDPAKLVSEAAGNIGPFAAIGTVGQAARLSGAAKTALTMGAAGAVGGGSVRGSIFEKIDQTPDADLLIESPEYYDLRVNQGLGEKEAKAKIGADLSRNLPEVAAGTVAGAIGGKFGVEGMAARVAPNMGRMTAMGVGLLDEGAQGAIEQVATNYGVQRAMPAQSLTEDVALNAAAEALPGGVAGLALGGQRPRLPDAGPLSRGVNAGLDAVEKSSGNVAARSDAAPADPAIDAPGLTEDQYNRGMDAVMAQGEEDAKAMKLAGMRDNSPPRTVSPAADGLAGFAPEVTADVGEVDALADRIMVTRQSLADEATRELIRSNMGDEALREAMYYVQQADMAKDIPDITRERMLGVAEEIVSRARLTPMESRTGGGTVNFAPTTEGLTGPAARPQIGLDMTPTGVLRADASGNVTPETNADRISTRQATQSREGDDRQARRASAVPADEAPRIPGKPKAIGYDTTPTGRMIAGETGVMVETQAERIQREQARKVQPGDKLNPSGNPFKNIAAARTEQRRSGGAVVEVDGGWVVRPQAEDTNGRTGETPRVPEQSGAGGAPDAIGGVGSDGRGVADGGNAVADRGGDGAGVPGDARGGQRAVPDRATGRERSDALTEAKKTPAFLKTKTVPEMTDDELRQAAEFYGPNHKRAKTIEKEMGKRAPKVPAVAEPKPSAPAAKQENRQDEDQPVKQAPAARQAGEAKEAQEVKALPSPQPNQGAQDGRKVQGQALAEEVTPSPLEAMTGERIDADWVAFSEASGTLGVPRAQMPQIKAEHRGAMVNFLNARGVEHEQEEVSPSTLKPTQAEFSPAKVEQAKAYEGGDRSILISQEDHVVDGHHQWLAKLDSGEPVKVIRLKAPVRDLLDQVKEFPSAEVADGAQEAAKVEAVPESTKPGPSGEQRTGVDQGSSSPNVSRGFGPQEHYTPPQNLAATFEAMGMDVKESGSAHSGSRYVRIDDTDGIGTIVVRFADHRQTDRAITLHGVADFNVGEFPGADFTTWQQARDAVIAKFNEERAQYDIELIKPSDQSAPESPGAMPVAVKEAAKPSANTIFTEDAAAKAREILRKKLGQLNSGLDPEIMQAGITLAGYHIEKGARTFAAYAQAMVSDLGESVRPYLKSWYMGVKYDPRASGFDGMSTAAEVESASVDAPTNAPVDQAAQPAQTADETTSENQDERRNLRSESPQALDEVVAEDDGRTEEGRQVQRSRADGGEERAQDGSGVDGAGVPASRGRGSRAGSVRSSEAGARRRADRLGGERTGRNGGAVSGSNEGAARPGTAGAVTPAAPVIPAQNFQITPDLRLGQGGEVEKFNDNLNAIKTLKALEAERRRATPEEQRILARYVGWGGLANAFPDPMSGEFKDKWKARGEELKALLTPKEYADARRSTRNAHYTSEVVVNAMWDAARRLGFRGGLVLESSMGSGNFLGLKPSDLPARFIGVEYDSLTSRIAQALYPQAAVLNSGFQKVPVADNAFSLNIGNPPFGSESLRFQYKPELQGVSIHNQFFRAGMDAVRPGGLQIMVVSRFLMDAQDKSTRVALARQADLVAAIRLPDTAFKENARTEVVTDIIILRKLTPAEQAEREAVIDNYLKPAGAKDKDRALSAQAPAWIEVDKVRDPLGGEAMTVNRYFAQNPAQIMGVLERSGSMQHGADITVRLDDAKALPKMLADAVARLPENVSRIPDEVLEATEERFSLLADALRIAVANEEVGHMKFDEGGDIVRVIEREAPDGGYIMTRQKITADSPWSEQLSMDSQGRWYKLEVEMGQDGKPVKAVGKDGKPSRLNVYKRTTYANESEVPDGMRLGQTGYERLKELVTLRDLLKEQLALETEDAPKAKMEANRKKLAEAYKAFVAKHGPVNRSTNMALAMTMPDGGLIAALEVGYQPERTKAQAARSGMEAQSESATPAPILSERVVPKYEPPTKAGTAADALAISLAERGVVDIERIASLRGKTPEETIAELQAGEKPLVFRDPETETWETADAYLSGMVRRKLNAAREMAARDQRYEANVKALEAVQPEAWTAENVTAQMGSTWVPGDVYADFITSLIGGKATVSFSPISNSFTVGVKEADRSKLAQWSTEGAPADYIVTRLLNSQAVVVTYKDENGSVKVAQEETALAQLKAKEIVAEFGDWVFKDGDRRQRLVDLFNEKFNTRVNRQFDGSHLNLPGKVPDTILKMRRHQKNAIWRGIASRFLLLDHVVGAGKTFTGIARAMERRRMGLARKPMIVVPNHLVEQWAADVYRLYPGAKVLAAGQKDFEAKRRRRLFGKIATGDWDIVIVPHSSFGFIGISPETEMRFLEQEMAEAKAAIEAAWEQAKEDGQDNGYRKPFGVKEAERLAEKIQTRMDKLQSGVRDRLLTFEQLGVDDLTVDEAHEFKNLFYSSRLTGVRGMGNKAGSRKAADLYNKVRVMREGGGAVTFMTGTPISNSAVEMYTMMRYLAADELKEQGLEHFDAWRAQSVEASAAFEPTESGRLKEVTRLGRTWANMRALMDTYYGFTDAVSIDDIKKWYAEDNNGKPFPVPKVKGGDRALVKITPTQAQESALRDIIAGFDSLDGIKDPFERNKERLRLMDRARKVSLDIRAVDPTSTSKEEGGKLARVSAEVKRIYDKTTKDRGTQLVFLDRSVPKAKGDEKIIKEYDELVAKRDKALKTGDEEAFQVANEALERYDSNEIAELRAAQSSGWNAYQQIKDNLVAMGIPANEVRFVQEAQNDEQKAALFEAVRGGKVRVLIGSTPRMGAGTNVQDRLVGLHHVDVTWKPSDIEQREGRIIRQGNKLLEQYGPDGFEVEIMAYATERTVDAKMWDLNAQKLRMINGIRKYDGAFLMEFEDEESVSMAEMAALASGNPLLLERVTLESQIGNLELQERAHRRKMYGVLDAIQSAERALAENPARIKQAEERGRDAQARLLKVEEAHQKRAVVVEGVEYKDAMAANRAALAAVEAQQDGNANARYAVSIDGKRLTNKEAISDAIGAALGDSQPFLVKVGGTEYAQRTGAGREVARLVSEAKASLAGGEKSISLGEMLGYKLVADLSSEATARGDRVTQVDMHLVDGDKTIASERATIEGIVQMTTQQGRRLLEQLESSIASRAEYESSIRYLKNQMERAERDLPELRQRKGEPFPKAQELADKRERLKEVVSVLSSGVEAASDQGQNDTPAFSRAEGFRRTASAAVSAKKAEVQGIIDRLTATWKNAPEIIVLGTFDEAPESVKALNARQVAGGASGVPEAFVSGGKAYIVADQMPNEKAVAKAVFHEVLGHRGLRGVYGAELGAILDQIRKARARDVFLMAGRYGMDTDSERDMRAAAEEVLAGFAEKNPQLGFVRRAVAAVRSWLRRNVPMLSKMRMTDDEIINDFIIPARRFITEGPGGPRGGMIPAFKREKDAMSRDEIAFSRSAAAGQYTAQAREAFMDFVGNAGAQVDWLDRTFKTQYAKAQKFPAFGRVFNKLQEYIEGVSTLANQAADNAPSILPKLETWRDLAKTGLSEADAKAVAGPIFQGTLEWARKDGKLVRVDDLVAQAEGMTADQKARQLFKDGKVTEQQLKTWKASPLDIYEGAVRNRYESEYLTGGVVFTAPELKSMFGLNDSQIGQYNEFRAAINDSLDQLVAADVLRLIGNVPEGMKAMALDPQGRKGLRQAVEELLADEDPALWNKVADKFNQVDRLKERGYAPLSRFGKFWVHVVDDQGQTQYFGMAETRSEANQLARALRAEFPQGTVEQGVMSQEFHKLMSAVPIDAMELFAEAIGADESEVFQKYIQLAKNNRSTMKRLLKRKGTSGFSQDVGRVLASFVTSNARAASTALHIKDAKDMARDIAAGDVKDEAIKLIESVTEPEESGAGVRSLMFTNFIGGSIASAVVNATQPFMMTLPYLSQWGGAATAGRRMLAAMRMLSGKVAQDPDLAQALKRAEDDGIVSPQEIHHLINRAAGGVGSRFPVLQKVAFVWAAPFSLAEQFNRRISFVAAYLTAKEQGIKNPFAFAEKAVIETQGLYNSGNIPNVSRGVIGATAMTFRQYSIHYLEWLARMAKSGPDGKRAVLLALALLMLAAGTDGLPFMDDLDDVLDTAGQAMGYDMNTKRARREFIASILGEELGEVATRGVSAAAGFPVDLSLRMGMGNLLPATDLLLKSNTDTARSLAEIAGPGGSMFIQYRDAAKMVLNGDPLGGAAKALPVAGQNFVKGIEMGQEGEYRDSLGRRVMETSPLEAGMKALSFQPATVARESARMQESRQSENLAKQVENEIVDKWARAIADRDRDAEKEALKMRDEWNAKNPDMPIVVKRSQAIRKARNLKMDRRERYIKTVAPERRDSVDKEMG